MLHKICVEYPPGAGGAFLASVLGHCTENLHWVSKKRMNFHDLSKIENCHYTESAQNVISIDSTDARYNFWINYFRKRVAYELSRYNYEGCRWIRAPYKYETRHNDGFWVLNQCRYIISYRSSQPWKISWTEMLQDPGAVWQVIHEFLDANHQHNYWKVDKWIQAVNDYKQTLSKIKINTNHVSWQIWATALLQEQDITPSFDLIDNFKKPQFFQWLNGYQQNLVETTQKCIWTPG